MARDPESWMWAEAMDFLERAERLHRELFRPGRSPRRRPAWEPPVDIFETDGELWIVAALLGVEPDQVQVTVDSGVVRIAGERRLPPEAREGIIHRLEIPHGRFERCIELPPGLFEVGRRDLVNGLLVLSLRKLR